MPIKHNQRTKFYPNQTMGKCSKLEEEGRGGVGVGRKKCKCYKCHLKINLNIKFYQNRTTILCLGGKTVWGERKNLRKIQTLQMIYNPKNGLQGVPRKSPDV